MEVKIRNFMKNVDGFKVLCEKINGVTVISNLACPPNTQFMKKKVGQIYLCSITFYNNHLLIMSCCLDFRFKSFLQFPLFCQETYVAEPSLVLSFEKTKFLKFATLILADG